MLVTFTCEAHGDITMFGDVAEHMLKLMGHSGTIPSAFFAKDVPAVLERLKHALESEQAAPVESTSSDDDHMDVGGRVTPGAVTEEAKAEQRPRVVSGTTTEDDDDEPPMSTAVRAFPLIEMLTAAAEAGCNVMWRKN